MQFVYILKCSDERYYTGLTHDIKKRFQEHTRGLVPSTRSRRPVSLVFFAGFANRKIAAEFETYLKTNSGRAFRNKHFISSQDKLGLPDLS